MEFWHLDCPDNTACYAEWDEGMSYEDGSICNVQPSNHKGMGGRRMGDLKVIIKKKNFFDMMWTWNSELLVQEHVLELFRAEEISGYEARPVRGRYCDRTVVASPKFWEIQKTGWGGVAALESGVRLLERCPGCSYTRYRAAIHPEKVLDGSQWDGSDFFLVWPYPMYYIISNRVAVLIRKRGLTGAEIRPVKDAFTSKLSGESAKSLSPGSIMSYFPEEKARHISELYGVP